MRATAVDARDCRILRRGASVPLREVAPATALGARRYPLISYGTDASLDGLGRKFRKAGGENRITPVITGTLSGYVTRLGSASL